MKVVIEVEDCSRCPHFKSSPYPTADSFERPEYWWCKEDDEIAPNTSAEEHRQFIKRDEKLEKLRYIAGYVEWNDDTPIPDWCPAKLQNKE